MLFWCSVVFVFFVLFLVRYKKTGVPSVFFFLLWGLVMILGSLKLFDMYETSKLALTVIGMGCVSFACGSILFELFSMKSYTVKVKYDTYVPYNNIANDKLLTLIFTVTAFMASIVLLAAIRAYMAGFDMKSLRYEGVISKFLIIPMELYDFAYMLIIKPVTILSIPVACLTFKLGNRISNYRYQLYMLYLVAIDIIATGSRYDIVYLGICIWFTLSIRKLEFKYFAQKTWKWLKRFFWIAPIMLLVISFIRGSSGLWRSFYTYLSGCMPYISILLERNTVIDNMGTPFYGILYPLTFVLKQLNLISDYPDFIYEVTSVTDAVQSGAMISPEIPYNAFVSPVYHLYIGGGYAAVIFGMALLGWLCMAVYRKAMRTNLMWNWVSYLMIMIAIFKTIQAYPFVDIPWSIGFMLCMFFSFKNKKIGVKKQASYTEVR